MMSGLVFLSVLLSVLLSVSIGVRRLMGRSCPVVVSGILFVVMFVVMCTVWAPNVRAQDSDGTPSAPATPVAPPLTPSLMSPGRAADLVYVGVEGGVDGPRRVGVFETNVEATVAGPLSFRVGASDSPTDRRVTPSFLLKLDVLRQGRQGVDAALFGGYRGEGFNLVPAVEVGVALGRRSDRLTFLSSLAYGQGLEQGERYGDVRVAGLVRVHRRVNLGLDARARFDLELDSNEPPGETTVDGVAGPLVVVGLGRFVLSGQTGVGVVAPRAGGSTQIGATTRVGVGAAF